MPMRFPLFIIPVVIAVLLVSASTVAGVTKSGNISFSPEEVWTYEGSELNSTTGEWSAGVYWDANSDDLAEIIVEIDNYTYRTMEIEVLNGADGNPLAKNIFTDVGSVESGDTVAIEPTLYGETVLDSTGTPKEHYGWMVFTNHTNNHRVSIYEIDNKTLQNLTYRGIDIPTQLSYGGFAGAVNDYSCILHPLRWDNGVYLLYLGYYAATVYGSYGISEIQMIMMDNDLHIVWERSEKYPTSTDTFMMGVDITSLMGWGFNGDTSDIIYVNLTASPGNTTLVAIDNVDGSAIWTSVVPGVLIMFDPLSVLNNPFVYQMDYNHDKRVDLAVETIDADTNETYIYFVDAQGTILGYIPIGEKMFGYFSMPTDYKIPSSVHTIFKTIDVNGDGYGEIFIINNNTEIFCWDVKNNASLWSKSLVNQSYNYGVFLSTNDVDGDGVWDIYIVGMRDTDTGKIANITALNAVSGAPLWNKTYNHLVGGFPGMAVLKELSDINGDGYQDAILIDGYYNDGNVYVNVTVISLKDGSTVWRVKVYSRLNNNDYSNWSANAMCIGDIDGDGNKDIAIELVYYKYIGSDEYVWSYLSLLSGDNGGLLWTGHVDDDSVPLKADSFIPITLASGWNQFDYNSDGLENEILLTTGFSVHIYTVTGIIPEFELGVLFGVLPLMLGVFALRKRWF